MECGAAISPDYESSSGVAVGSDFLALAPRLLRSSTWANRLPGPVFSLPSAPS